MLEKKLSYIANYMWKHSINNINTVLSDTASKNFNMNDYYYLTTIYHLGKPNFGELTEALNLTKPAISALVKRLQKNELIDKAQSEEDRRVFYLTVSDKGRRIIEGDNELYAVLSELISAIIPAEQLENLDCLLGEVIERLKDK